MRKYFDTVISSSTGLPVGNALVAVTDVSGNAVQLYSDNGITPISSPINQVSTNVLGLFQFYVPDGVYTLTYTFGGGPPVVIPQVTIGDPGTLSYGTYNILVDTTWAQDLLIFPNVSINVASGKTLTITGAFTSPLTKIFTGLGSVNLTLAKIDAVYPQWWGAKGDGLTDDTTAIQSAINSIGAGKVRFIAGDPYYKVSAGINPSCLSLTTSDIVLEGDGSETCQILSNDATGDILRINGSALPYASHIKISGISFGRTVAPSLGSANNGIKADNTVWLTLDDVISYNSVNQFYLTNCKSGYYINCKAFRTSPSRGGTDNYYGFVAKASNYTSLYTACRSLADASDTAFPYTGPSYGFLFDGTDLRDIWLRDCQSDLSQYGYYVDGANTASGGSDQNWDIHFDGCKSDSYGTAGFSLKNLLGYSTSSISERWTNAGVTGAATYGILIDNVNNLSVTGGQDFGVGNTQFHTGLSATRINNLVVSGCVFNSPNIAVLLDASAGGGFASMCSFTNVSVFNSNTTYNTAAAFRLKNATGNTFVANVLGGKRTGSIVRGYDLDSTSSANSITANIFASGIVTTPIVYTASIGNRGVANPGVTDF